MPDTDPRPSPDDGFQAIPIHSAGQQRELILQSAQRSPCCNRDLRNQPQANAVGAGKIGGK